MCIGICVLLAIVYVLSRTGDRDAITSTVGKQPHNNIRVENPPLVVPTSPAVPADDDWDAPVKAATKNAVSPIASHTPSHNSAQGDAACHCYLSPDEAMGVLRQQALSKTTPHIIECAAADAGKSQAACHLPAEERFAALGQKGATLWVSHFQTHMWEKASAVDRYSLHFTR